MSDQRPVTQGVKGDVCGQNSLAIIALAFIPVFNDLWITKNFSATNYSLPDT